MNIKTLTFGCRLNALENEKIAKMLAPHVEYAIIVNTCAVTAEAERQSGQAVRKLARENESTPIFVTGCAATRNPGLFDNIPNVTVVSNFEKLNLAAYLPNPGAVRHPAPAGNQPATKEYQNTSNKMSKQFIQIQNGCNHACTYCITRILRGKNVAFDYADILADARAAVQNGFFEIVLTGVDIASYHSESEKRKSESGNVLLLTDICRKLLNDVPEIQRLRLSSMDPASPEIPKIVELMTNEPRMLPHMHLSMQSGSDPILAAMLRRHNAQMVRNIVKNAPHVSFSWDIICGFPGETEELFNETVELARELKPIKIHAFPFSPRPGTVAADMDGQVNRHDAKQRVKIISDIADDNKREFMKSRIGTITQVLMEEKNIARDVHDIEVKIQGTPIPARTICNVRLVGISDLHFVAEIC